MQMLSCGSQMRQIRSCRHQLWCVTCDQSAYVLLELMSGVVPTLSSSESSKRLATVSCARLVPQAPLG